MVNLTSDKNLDKHLKIIKSGEENTSLELATEGNGAKIKGNLEITGSIVNPIGQFNITGDYIVVDGGILYMINLGNRLHFTEDTTQDLYDFYAVQNYDTCLHITNAKTKGIQTKIKGGTITAADTSNLYDSALTVSATLNDTSDSGSCVYKLIEGVATNTDITGWDELYLLHLTGARTFYVDNAGNVALSATGRLLFDGDTGGHTYIAQTSDDVLDMYVGADKMLTLDEANDKITMGATNWVAGTVSGGTVTEFSVANSAYAGMILGYTALRNLGTSADEDVITLDTSFTVLETSHGNKANVSFKAPPSGNVEIEFTALCSGSSKSFFFALSDNATYNELHAIHTYDSFVPKIDETDSVMNTIRWVITGLTAGTSYQYWVAGKTNSGNAYIYHGSSDRFGQHSSPITVKAIALPATITTGE